MKNKRRIKIALLAALGACVVLLCSSCSQEAITYTGRLKKIPAGKHTVGVFLEQIGGYENFEIPEYPGYEAVSAAYKDSGYWVVMYRNTEEVECAETSKGYIEIGVPTKNVTMKLVQEE